MKKPKPKNCPAKVVSGICDAVENSIGVITTYWQAEMSVGCGSTVTTAPVPSMETQLAIGLALTLPP